jgi:ribonuclease HI
MQLNLLGDTNTTKEPLHAVIFADGGSRGNPGPAAYGYSVQSPDGEPLKEDGVTIGIATNNRAEYLGMIEGMKAARDLGVTHLKVKLDSKLAVCQMKGEWKVKHPDMKLLWREAKEVETAFQKIEFIHVYRENNTRADALVNKALDAQH